jgi:26S proteasome regulatory subunit N6
LGPVWPAFARAKAAKLIKSLLELFDDMGDAALELEIALCRELLAWSETEKRAFLKQALDTRLIALYHRTAHYTEALVLVGTVLRQLKRLDDKLALIEVHLLESRIYFALKNVAKARAALTAARAYANAMYTPPLLQAALDVQAGLLHAEETDFKTAFSYFIEAFDNYVACDRDPRGAQALKYMLLCKIMLGLAEDVSVILAGKFGQHYPVTRHFEAMLAVAAAYQAKSLRDFETALSTFPHELGEDPIVQGHFAALYDDLLERNLLRIVLPYSRVQIAFVAGAIGLSLHDVELKLSQMILDKVLNAIIDQNSGCLVVREEPKVDRSFELVQDCFKNIGGAIDSLHVKSSRLS